MDTIFVLKKPVLSERSQGLAASGRFIFQVAREASKPQIKKAVEGQFGVKVKRVWTQKLAPKPKRAMKLRKIFYTPPGKKAIVQLEKGQTIDLFDQGEKKEGKKKKAKE